MLGAQQYVQTLWKVCTRSRTNVTASSLMVSLCYTTIPVSV